MRLPSPQLNFDGNPSVMLRHSHAPDHLRTGVPEPSWVEGSADQAGNVTGHESHLLSSDAEYEFRRHVIAQRAGVDNIGQNLHADGQRQNSMVVAEISNEDAHRHAQPSVRR